MEAIIDRQRAITHDNEELNIEIIKDKYNVTAAGQKRKLITELEKLMTQYANDWEFERAAQVRDEIRELQK